MSLLLTYWKPIAILLLMIVLPIGGYLHGRSVANTDCANKFENAQLAAADKTAAMQKVVNIAESNYEAEKSKNDAAFTDATNEVHYEYSNNSDYVHCHVGHDFVLLYGKLAAAGASPVAQLSK